MGQLPANLSLAKTIRRVRNQINQAPPDPQSLSELIIPDSFQQYEGEKFLLIDTGADDPNRIIVFGRESYADWAHQVTHLYMDGTFKVGKRYLIHYLVLFLDLSVTVWSVV